MTETETDTSQVVINRGGAVASGDSHEWDNYPDGIRLEEYKGKTFNAHIMIVKDPSRVSLGRSEEHTSELQSRETRSYAVFCLKKKN